MKKKIFFYLVGSLGYLFILCNIAYADNLYEIYDIFHKQKYMIRMHVSLEEAYLKEKIILSLLRQQKVIDTRTFIIPDLTGVGHTEILAETFLSFTYTQKAGTGINMRATKFIGVKDDRLFVVLRLLTTNNFYAPDLGEEKYEVTLDLKGNSYKNYTLLVKESRYLNVPPQNEKWEKEFTIPFNYKEMLFTNGQQTLSGMFIFEDPFTDTKTKKEERLLKNMKVNKLTLRNQEYLHIDNNWYIIIGKRLIKKN